MTIFGKHISLNMLVLLLLVVIAFGSSGASLIVDSTDRSAEWWSGWLQNFSTEIIGAIATFALFELLVGGRKETADTKARLIREAGSKDNATVLNALKEIEERGWLRGGNGILQGENLQNADLQGTYLFEANLQGTNLWEANLHGVDMSESNLKSADLRRAHLEGTHLIEANLQKAFLRGTYLKKANLRRANLEGADVSESNLQGANLIEANLQGTYLSGAELENACVANAKFNKNTTLPSRKKWTPETDMAQFGCFVDIQKYEEWLESQKK